MQAVTVPACLAALALAALGAVAPPAAGSATRWQDLPKEPSLAQGKAHFERICSGCHPLEEITSPRTHADWSETIDRMAEIGSPGSEQELAAVLHYLAAEYGRVNVNKARAAEIAEVLGLSDKEAALIVKHRDDYGKIQGFDALLKIPGVDAARLEQKKSAVSF